MKKLIVLSEIIALAFTTCAIVLAEEVKNIKGEVIDVSCYVSAGAKGMNHKDCAVSCLQAGQPAGILEDGTNKVYIVVTEDHTTNPATKMLPYVAEMVEVTGAVNERGGVSTVDVKDIKEISSMPEKSMDMMKEKKSAGY